MSEPKQSTGVEISVEKFDIPTLLEAAPQETFDGMIQWPIPPLALALLYQSSPEHGRAIHVKAQGCFGRGLSGADAEKLNMLFENGATDAFVDLGIDLETYGNAFIQKIRTARGEIVELRRLPAVTMSRTRTGFAQVIMQPGETIGKVTKFRKDDILHLRVPCPMGRHYAFPSWIGVHGMLELANAATRYNANFFKNGAMPEYAIITRGSQLNEKQKSQARDFFQRDFRGVGNSHRTIYLHLTGDKAETDIDFKQLTSDVKDGDFLKLLDAARDRIPIAHGVPPRMLGIVTGGQLGGGGEISGQLFSFEHLTCQPSRSRTLSQCRKLFEELGIRDIDFEPLDLTPPGDDAKYLSDWVESGIMTEEEARLVIPSLETNRNGAASPLQRSASETRASRLARLIERL